MTRDEDFSRIPSADELQALFAGDSQERAGPAPRVLLVSRRRDETELLRDQLVQMGCSVTVVRDPFAALDQLRLERQDLVVSEFDIWADDAAVLFERMSSSGEPVPVVFVGERDADFVSAARDAGARGILTRPLRASEIGAAVRATLLGESATAGGASLSGESSEGEPSEQPAAGGSRMPEELEWLRFFFDVRQRLRASPEIATRLAELVGCLERHLRPRGAVIAERTASGLRVLVHGDGDAGCDLDDASLLEPLVNRALTGARDDSEAFPNIVELEVQGQGGRALRCLVELDGEPPPEHRKYIDELRALLEEL